MPEYVEFQLKDLTVISILWAYRMFSLWLYSLCLYTFHVLFPDKELQSAYFYYVDFWIFFLVCAGIIFGALLVDTFGHRYAMSVTGLCLCCSTPFIGAFTCITKTAPTAILMFFTASGISIVSPATYCLIFNQNLVPRRRHARLVVSFFECMESLIGQYLVYICIPGRPSGTFHELNFAIVLWVMFIPLLVTLVVLSERVKNHLTGDFVNEKGIQVLHGLFSDVRIQPPKRKGKSSTQVVFFILLLLPSLCLTSLGAALNNANSDEEAKEQSPVLKHISLTANVMIIPFTELVLTLVPMIKETFREILVVGFAHVINIAVLSLFVFRLDNMPVTPPNSMEVRKEFNDDRDAPERLRGDAEVCVDPERCSMPQPTAGKISFIVMTSADVTLHTLPKSFFDKVPFTLNAAHFVYGIYLMPGLISELKLQFYYRFKSLSPSSILATLTERKHYVFVLTSGHQKNIACSVVTGMEGVKPKANPQLILFNSLCNKLILGITNNINDHEYHITSTESGVDERHTFPEICAYKVTELPVGKVTVSYKYKGLNPAIFSVLKSDSATFTTEPSVVYLAFVLYDASRLSLFIRRIYKPEPVTIPPVTTTTTEKPPQPRDPDPVQQSTYALSGAALGIAAVGYTHFFWVESPVRLRAVMFALFRVSNELVRWTTEKMVGDSFTRQAAIGILSIQVVTTVWHVGLSWIYQTIIARSAKESTMEPPS